MESDVLPIQWGLGILICFGIAMLFAGFAAEA